MSFRQYLQHLRRFVSGRGPSVRRRPSSPRLTPELLEDRTLLSVVFTPGPYAVPTVTQSDSQLGGYGPFRPIETQVSINPTDPGNVVVSSHNDLRVSTNAGGVFSADNFFVPPPGANTGAGDTGTTFDAAGRLYWTNLAGPGTVGVSVDQLDPTTGATLTTSLVGANSDDKQFLAADTYPNSPNFGNVYIAWTRFGVSPPEVFFARSLDQGQTWSNALQLSTPKESFAWPVTVAVAPNGDVYVAYHSQTGYGPAGPGPDLLSNADGTSGKVVVVRSTDGGQTFGQKTLAFTAGKADITDNTQTAPTRVLPGAVFWTQGSTQPYVLPDPTRAGTIYVVAADDPANGKPSNDPSDIVLAVSGDNGNTWKTSTIASAPNSFRFFPTANIDQWGDLVVTYYSNERGMKNAAGDYLLDLYSKYSTDGGATWSPEFMVNDPSDPFDPDPGAVPRFNNPPPATTRIGEYQGLALFGGTAYASWDANFFDPLTGAPISQQVDFKAFPIAGTLTVNPDAGGPTNNNFVVRGIAGNPGFLEVLVNGQRQYAGLVSALSGGITVNGGAGNDTLTIDFTNGNPLPSGGLNFVAPTTSPANNLLQLVGASSFTNETFSPGLGGTGSISFDNGGPTVATLSYSNVLTVDDTAQVTKDLVQGTAAAEQINVLDQPTPVNGLTATLVTFSSLPGTVINVANKGTLAVGGVDGHDTFTLNNPNPGNGVNAEALVGGPAGSTFDIQNIDVPASAIGGAGNDTFNVDNAANALTGIRAVVSLDGGGGSNLLNVISDANFTLADTQLTANLVPSGKVTINLANIQTANLTGGPSNNKFDVGGWTGGGTLDGQAGTDTVTAAGNVNYTLSNTALARSGLPTLTLASIESANLTATGNNLLDVSGWTGTGSLTGKGADTVSVATDANITLADKALSASDGLSMTLSGIRVGDLTGTGNDVLDVGGWTGSGALVGLGSDTVAATKDADQTLADTGLTSSDGMSMTLAGVTTANLTGGPSSNRFDVSGWTGGGTLDGRGGVDTVLATDDTNFTLTNTSLARIGHGTLTLARIEAAQLTGGSGDNNFDVGGWTGFGTVTGGGGNDTISATKDANFTLTNATLSSSDLMTLALNGLNFAHLIAAGGDAFDVSGWTHGGTLAGTGGSDTVTATKSTDFTLADTSLGSGDGMSLTLAAVRTAKLTGGPGNDNFDVGGWTGTGTLTGGGGSDTVSATKNTTFVLANATLATGDGMTVSLNAINSARLTASGNDLFDVSGWTHGGTLTGGGGSDAVTATKDVNFTLADTRLITSDGMNVSLAGINAATLTGGSGNNAFDVSGWSSPATLNGLSGTDTVVASNNTDFTLSNTTLSRAGLPNVTLINIQDANLTGGAANNTFDVSGWTRGGTLTGGGGNDTVTATKNANFTLNAAGLSSSDGMALTLSGIGTARLTSGTANNTFAVSDWPGSAILTGGGGNDTVTVARDANFTLTNTLLTTNDGLSLTLAGITTADLTGGAGNNSFTLTGWAGTAAIDGQGGTNTLIDGGNTDFTLTNSALIRPGLPTISLANVTVADLVGGAGTHNFDVSGWTGTGSLTGGGGSDTITATKDTNFTLTDTSLKTGDNMSLLLSGIHTANLAGGPGNNNFDVSGWTGVGTLSGNAGSDTVTATKDTDFTLTNTSLATKDGMNLTLNAIGAANLTGGPGNNTFNVIGWTGAGTLTGGGGNDTVSATKDANFSLSNTALSSSDGMSLVLNGIHTANLTGGPGNNLFAIGVWSGNGALTGGGGSDTLTVTKDFDITLADALLSSSDGTSFVLSGIGTADLTGGPSANTFTVTDWTGNANLDGQGGTDTVVASNDVNFTLSNTALVRPGLPTITLASMEAADLTAGPASHTFDVSGWTGTGVLSGTAGNDTITANRNTSFTLTNTGLSSSDNMNLALAGFTVANLMGGAGNNTFDVSGWTGTGSLAGGGGSDTVIATKDKDFTLTNAALSTGDGMSLALSAIRTAKLTGGASNNTFNVTGWTGAGSLSGGGGTDTVVAVKNADFSLSNTALTAGDGMSLALSAIGIANLAVGSGNNLFTIGTWTGTGSLTGGGGSDTVTATRDANFTLTDNLLGTSDNMSLVLSGIHTANLIGGPSANTFTLTGWTGGGSIDGQGGTNTVVASNNTDFTLTSTALFRAGLPALGLANVEAASLTGGAGNNNFAITDFTGSATLTGGGGNDSVTVSRDASYTLSNAALLTSDGLSLTLNGIGTANLTGGAGNNNFVVSGWTGNGTLTGGGGSDSITATKDADFTLTDNGLTTSDKMSLVLHGIGTANLTGGPGANTFDVGGWSGGGSLDGQAGTDTIVASDDGDFTLTNTSLARSGRSTLTLANFEAASLTGGPGNNTFDLSGWTDPATVTGGGGSDTIAVAANADFTLTNAALIVSDGLTVALHGIAEAGGAANLTGGAGKNTFDVSGWTGGGSITGGGGSDTINVVKDASFMLTNTALQASDGLNLALNGLGTANLTGGPGADTFSLSGWTGGGSLTATGANGTVNATKNPDFTLSNTALSSSDGLKMVLTGFVAANLTGGPGVTTFDVGGWTGIGSLSGNKADIVVASKDTDFTLSDTALKTSDGMSLTLSTLGVANLTGGPGIHTFDVGGWTGTGSLIGNGGNYTLTAAKNADFTLADKSLAASDGLNLTLAAIGTAALTGLGNNAITVTDWTGTGTLKGGTGTDTVVARNNVDFILTNTSLARSTRPTLTLTGIGAANLTGGAGNNTFDVSGWSGGGSLVGGGGSDTVTATKATPPNISFTLSNTALSSSDNMNLGLAGIRTANLTGGSGNDSFTVSGWTGTGTLTGGGTPNGGSDSVSAAKDVDVTLTNAVLSSGDGMTMALNGITAANLTGGPDPNTFNVSSWTGTGSVTGVGGNDTIRAAKNTDFTLSDTTLATGDGMSLTLNAVSFANLTGGTGDHRFDVGGWSGGGALTGGGGNDTVTATRDTNFTLADTSLSARDGLSLALAGIRTATLTGGAGNNAFDVSGWSGNATVTGGGGTDTVVASNDGDFTLANGFLARSGLPTVGLQGIAGADLTGGPGGNTFDVSGWTGGGVLNGGNGGVDRVLATGAANFGLSDGALSDSAGLSMALVHVPVAILTGGPGADAFGVSGWSGSSTLTGGAGPNSYAVAFKGGGGGLVSVNDSGASGASSLLVTGAPGGDAITVTGTQVVSGSEVVNYSGVASETVRGGSGPNAVTVDAAPGVGLNLFVDGGPSGANTLTVLDTTGNGVAHGSLATGTASVHYSQGPSTAVSFVNVQHLVLSPDALSSYAQSLFVDVLGRLGSPTDLQPTLNLLNSPKGGRRKAVLALEKSPAGRLHTVDSWFVQYTGGSGGPFVEAQFATQLKNNSDEVVLSRLLDSVFRGASGGNHILYLNLAGQALFGRALTSRELAKFLRKLHSAGGQAVLLAMLKSPTARTRLVQSYVRQLLRIPAGQPLSPSLQALVAQLAGSKLSQRSIRVILESSDQFFAQG
jgi:hypothetical protein